MRSNIVTIEDITNVVGIDNYIKSLTLDSKKLEYDYFLIKYKNIDLYFKYEDKVIIITVNKNLSILETKCSCHEDTSYCPHITLAVIYLFEHEDFVKEIVSELNNSYDEEFNNKLFNLYDNNKTKINLDVFLKQINNDSYELILKIGLDKKYSLKKQLNEFLEVYNNKLGEVVIGQNFVYEYDKYYFSEDDKKILDFVNVYVDSQNTDHNYYTYYSYSGLKTIKLTNSSLMNFMKILNNREFTIQKSLYEYKFNGIETNFPFKMHFNKQNSNIRWLIELGVVIPFTNDYSYVIYQNKMYYIKDKELFNMIYTNNKKEIIIKKEEFKKFSSNLLDKVSDYAETDGIDDIFINEEAKSRYYFEKDKNNILAKLRLCYDDIEIDINDDNNEFNGKFLKRNKEKEKFYKEELYNLKFNNDFVLEEKNVYDFLQKGLKDITSKHEVFVSKDIKDIKIHKNSNVCSTFSLGSNNILSYDFKIDNISDDELKDLILSLKNKKNYYKLKNGDFFDLNNSELKEFYNMTEILDIDINSYIEGNNFLPIYKGILLDNFSDKNFILLNKELTNLLDLFNEYKNIDINLSADDLKILRDYQVTGIKWMHTLSKIGFGGILADEMGLGKSIQTIKYIELKIKDDNKFLIVVPTSLIYNWQNELEKFSKNIKFLIVNDLKTVRINLLNDISNYDVIITTYGLLKQDIDLYSNYNFDTLIIDEAQNIKNSNTETTKAVKKIKATTKFALTGTPLENSVLEIWSIFDFVMPGFLSSLSNFKEKYNIKNIESDNKILNDLNYQISPFILRRKKKDVLKELPDKIETKYIVDMEEDQKKLYKITLEETKNKINETIRKDGFSKSQILILSLLTKLRQICIDPKLVVDNDFKGCKVIAVLDILKEVLVNNHKVLIFSQFPSALKILERELNNNFITYYYLDGSTKSKRRMELVDAFNQDNTNVFLISLKAGGTGLNLTSADIVIHLDPWWNPAVENQATDRSHRIGQKNKVEVIKIIAKGTIEEKIVELQEKKKNLSDKIVEGKNRDQIILTKLDETELKNILMN